MNNISRAVVVGCGRAGSGWDEWSEGGPPRTHAGCYQRSELTELVGLVDVDEHRVGDAAKRRGVAAFPNIHAALSVAFPDIVSVCTPPEEHLDCVRAAVDEGVPVVLCEKPLAHTVEDAREIVRLGEDSGTMIATMHHRRWMRGLDLVRTLLGGHATEVGIYYSGGMLNNGTHGIDLARSVVESWDRLAMEEMSRGFGAYLRNEDVFVGFENGGRSIEISDGAGRPLADVSADYDRARLRAIEQMARIAQGSDEAPLCTAEDGLRAVELAYEYMNAGVHP